MDISLINNKHMEIIIKEEKRIEKFEKKVDGEIVLDEKGEPEMETKEVIEQKKFIRKTILEDTPLDEAIQNLKNQKEELENRLSKIEVELEALVQEELKEQLLEINK